jgi:hypothetical protein
VSAEQDKRGDLHPEDKENDDVEPGKKRILVASINIGFLSNDAINDLGPVGDFPR